MPFRHGDDQTAAALRAGAAWLRTMFAILPLAVGVRIDDAHSLGHEITQTANTFADPYPVGDANFGWSRRPTRRRARNDQDSRAGEDRERQCQHPVSEVLVHRGP